MSDSNLRELHKNRHLIGLHSHNHPEKIANLKFDEQLHEYKTNQTIIKDILKTDKIISMSHPRGSYNKDTLKVLEELNIEIGFVTLMKNKYNSKKINNSKFEIAREDHTNIMKRLKK